MSRLLDKLRHAARTRGDRASHGKPEELLSRALQRAQAEREAQRTAKEEIAMVAALSAVAPQPEVTAISEPSVEPPEKPESPHGGGFAVALLAMAAAVAAAAYWNYSEPTAHPAVFKLEHNLDLNRTDASGQSSPPGRAPSK